MVDTKKKTTSRSKPAVVVPSTPITAVQQSGFRNFMIIAIVVTVLVVIGGGYSIYQLSRANIQKNNELRAQDAFITLAKLKKNKLDDSEKVMADLKQSEGNLPSRFDLVTKRALPSKPDFEGVINILNSLQNDTLVTVENISLEGSTVASSATATTAAGSATPQSSSTTAKPLPIGIKVTAGSNAIQDFFRKIELSVRVFDFQTMKLSGSGQGITLDMQYQTYYAEEPSIDNKKVSLPEYEKAINADQGAYK